MKVFTTTVLTFLKVYYSTLLCCTHININICAFVRMISVHSSHSQQQSVPLYLHVYSSSMYEL